MFATIDPEATGGDGAPLAYDVWSPDRQCVALRQGEVATVPGWAEKAVRGLAHVIECDEEGNPLGGGGGD